MAKLLGHHLVYLILFLSVFLLFASTEMGMVEARICQRRSKTWTGLCVNTGNCHRQCRNWEGAQRGACHAQFPGFACFCYFNC
ncbi:putative defensin, plant [Rosa chinensis]|uniref:Putative defensin, plant n=2 Tax=Rosa TaxID=3764 RepID=A0A2P6PYU2_ROSCH|nr:defensin-like protein 19 [Rosa chinensis]PRQ27076.1 putative defensin, plant [Rosa chinensis]